MQRACVAIAARAAIETSVVKRDVRLPLDGSKRPSFSLELPQVRHWRRVVAMRRKYRIRCCPTDHQACAIEQANRTERVGAQVGVPIYRSQRNPAPHAAEGENQCELRRVHRAASPQHAGYAR
ncbi:hypothetical protein EIP99_10860 [Xanthomonas campestris pv. raphani]